MCVTFCWVQSTMSVQVCLLFAAPLLGLLYLAGRAWVSRRVTHRSDSDVATFDDAETDDMHAPPPRPSNSPSRAARTSRNGVRAGPAGSLRSRARVHRGRVEDNPRASPSHKAPIQAAETVNDDEEEAVVEVVEVEEAVEEVVEVEEAAQDDVADDDEPDVLLTPPVGLTGPRTKFTSEEDEAILLYRRKGLQWGAIASRMPWRTVASLQARFRARLKEPARFGVTLAAYDVFTFKDETPANSPSGARRARDVAKRVPLVMAPTPRVEAPSSHRAHVRCGSPPPTPLARSKPPSSLPSTRPRASPPRRDLVADTEALTPQRLSHAATETLQLPRRNLFSPTAEGTIGGGEDDDDDSRERHALSASIQLEQIRSMLDRGGWGSEATEGNRSGAQDVAARGKGRMTDANGRVLRA